MESLSEIVEDVVDPISEVEFSLSDKTSGSIEYTDSRDVGLNISDDDWAIAWCVTEIPTSSSSELCPGGQGDTEGWSLTKPDSYTLTAGEGLKKVYLKVKSDDGEFVTVTFNTSIYLDATPPLVTLASPSDITTINVSAYTLVGTCSESNPVDVEVGGVSLQTSCVSGSWSVSDDLSAVPDGTVSVIVSQTDSAGNQSAPISTSVTKDATPVVIIPSLPTEGYYINIANEGSFTISGSCTEDGDVVVSGAVTDTITCTGGTYTKGYSGVSLPQGDLAIYLDMVDDSGNAADQITINFKKDTVAPVFDLQSITDGSYINQAASVGFSFAGNCSETGGSVVLTGSLSASFSCDGTSYSQAMDVSGLSDGAVTFTLSMTDVAGNSGTPITVNLVKDTVAPVITQTDFVSGTSISADQVTFGGVCDNTIAVNVVGTDSGSITCSGSTWSYTTASQTTDNTYGYTFSQVDGAGNTTSVVASWSRDYTAPTVDSVSIASGASEVNSLDVTVDVLASDLSDVTHIRIANANLGSNDCQSEYDNNFWKSYGSGVQSFSHVLNPGEGPKKVCVWAKDIAGNISTIVPSSGLIGTNADSVTYVKDEIPTITKLTVTNNKAGPNFGSTFFAVGDAVKIEYAATDVESLADNPITLYYSVDNETWNAIVTGVGGSNPGTSVAGTYSSFLAPTAGYFRIKAVAVDTAANQSVDALSAALNSGNWSVYAGTSDNGVGGANESVQFSKGTFGIGYGQLAVDPGTQDIYVVSGGSDGGIIKADAATGKSSYFMRAGSSSTLHTVANMSEEPVVHGDQTAIKFGADGHMYVVANRRMSRINLDTGDVKFLFGGGSDREEPYVGTDVDLLERSGFDVDANGHIYAFVDCGEPSGTWNDDFNNTVRLIKATYDSGSDSYTVSDLAGTCDLGVPVAGNGLDQAIGTYRYKHLLSLAVSSDGEVIYFGRKEYTYKIYQSKIWTTNLLSTGGIFFDRTQDVLWVGGGNITKNTNLRVAANNSETGSTYVGGGGGVCNANGTHISTACVNVYHGNGLGEVHIAWNGQLYFLDTGPRVRIVNPTDEKIYTLAGTKFFYGDGIDKQFIRPSRVSGIVWRTATDPNQSMFPEGLYFTDSNALTLAYINPSTGTTSILAGDQSMTNWTGSFGPNDSLGTQSSDRNLSALAFDSNGYPWMVVHNKLTKLKSDYTFDAIAPSGPRWSSAVQGDAATGFSPVRGYATMNMTLYKDEGAFLLGNAFESAVRTNGAVLQYHDYKNDIVQHLMGGQALPGGEAVVADQATPGALVSGTLSGRCNNQTGYCHTQYDEASDRLYFSEANKLRYVTSPRTPSSSTLVTMFDAGRYIDNFIHHPDGDRIYYVDNLGALYCYYIGGGTPQAHCDNTSLGPDSGFQAIATQNVGNSLTWKSSTELLMSTASREILLYRIPAD